MTKIYNIINEKDERNLKVGLTTGCFDIIHAGHVTFLKECKKYCDILIVAISSDNLVKKTKGNKRPIIGQKHRLKVVKSIKGVNYAFINNQFDTSLLSSDLGIDVFIKGGKVKGCELENVANKGIRVVNLKDTEKCSTTSIINTILYKY